MSIEINATNFPDAAWRQYVSNTFDTDHDGILSDAEISAITNLGFRAIEYSFQSVNIENFFNLKTIWITVGMSSLQSVEIKDCAALETIHVVGVLEYNAPMYMLPDPVIYHSSLTALAISGCPKVEQLIAPLNSIHELRITDMPKLEQVDVKSNLLDRLYLSGAPNLKMLYCWCSQLKDLNIDGLINLEHLIINSNELTSLSLPQAINLANVKVEDNQILSFSITGCTQLLRAFDRPSGYIYKPGDYSNKNGVKYKDYSKRPYVDFNVDVFTAITYETLAPPSITSSPVSATVTDGDVAKFIVSATGDSVRYQWQVSTDGENWSDIDDAILSEYKFKAELSENQNQYRCKVYNPSGEVYSRVALLTVEEKQASSTGEVNRKISNKIYVGSLTEPAFYYENDSIMSINTTQCVSLIGQELSIDTLTATVIASFDESHNLVLFRSSDGKLIECSNGSILALDISAIAPSGIIFISEWTPVWYFQDDVLVGKFYTESVKRLSAAQYQLNCVSAIGRIDRMYHGGGLFEVSTFGTVLAHILASGLHGDGAPVIDYYIDDDVAELTVSGWLPYASKRNNLYQLIFSHGINIIKNADGNPRFTFVYTSSNASEPIPDDDIFISGNVEYTKAYSGVSIMEHTYSAIEDNDPVTLYDNTESSRVADEEIWFDQAPVIVSTLQATEGLTVVSATENSAVITGNGKLTGIPYTHTTRTVSRANSTGDKEKTVSVERCTMVNVLNSENLLNRLFAFYCPPDYIKKISNELVYNDERCGKQYRFSNPYMEQEDALLSKMDLNATTFNRARCEFCSGYDPVGQAGLYQNCIILDKATFAEDGGTFVVPQEILEAEDPSMRVVMIGGGQGGDGGSAGASGGTATVYAYVSKDTDISGMWAGAEGGAGGNGGLGGAPGRVKAVTINNPSASYRYTIGTGGEGGPASTTGANGTASTFDIYSSADEEGSYIPVAGVYNPIFGEFYALKGKSGIAGGQGGAWKGSGDGNFVWHTDGCNVMVGGTEYKGGRTGSPLTSVPGLPECPVIAYGGNGAGAAVGVDRADHPEMDGKSDQDAYWEVVENGV